MLFVIFPNSPGHQYVALGKSVPLLQTESVGHEGADHPFCMTILLGADLPPVGDEGKGMGRKPFSAQQIIRKLWEGEVALCYGRIPNLRITALYTHLK